MEHSARMSEAKGSGTKEVTKRKVLRLLMAGMWYLMDGIES